jgi:3-hydroxyisobutyrate dehydrogenase/glyoxylate/succinic semialdehyde reductase
MRIGFIGLGIMGSRMAATLRSHACELVVHNRTREKNDSLVANSSTWAGKPAGAAKQVDILFTMPSILGAVCETALGMDGLLDNLKENSI